MEHAPKKRKFLGEDGDQKFASARLSKTAFSPGVGLEMVATAGGKKVKNDSDFLFVKKFLCFLFLVFRVYYVEKL